MHRPADRAADERADETKDERKEYAVMEVTQADAR